jgi:hypothetical protein
MYNAYSSARRTPRAVERLALATAAALLWALLQSIGWQGHPSPQPARVSTVRSLAGLSRHALEAHPEARAIHSACRQHLANKAKAMRQGVLSLFRKNGGDRFIILCKYGEPDLWGIEIRTSVGESVTAFRPGDGTLTEVLRYILEQAARYTGDLPWFN